MATYEKKIREQNPALLKEIRKQPCSVCGAYPPSDASHIKTRKSGGPDSAFNVWPKCRRCHTEWGQIGWSKFFRKYPKFWIKLQSNGWRVVDGRRLSHAYLEEEE